MVIVIYNYCPYFLPNKEGGEVGGGVGRRGELESRLQ